MPFKSKQLSMTVYYMASAISVMAGFLLIHNAISAGFAQFKGNYFTLKESPVAFYITAMIPAAGIFTLATLMFFMGEQIRLRK